VPGAAAGLTDVLATDLHPPVVPRRVQHLAQQLAVAGLDQGPLAQRQARLGDSLRERIPHPLQLSEVEDPRLGGNRPDPVAELNPAEGLAEESGQLALEPAHLAAQLDARGVLVDLDAEPIDTLSFKQIRHRPGSQCRSRCRVRERGNR
jgi:hypothetical protein